MPQWWNVICIDMTDFERLNDINQRVWEQGFTASNLRDLKTLSEDIKNGAAVFERIPYAQQSGLSKGSEVLCAASIICRGCPRTESETRQIYDTDDLFGEDISQLLSICSIVYNCKIEILSDIFGVLHICINEKCIRNTAVRKICYICTCSAEHLMVIFINN